MVEQSNQNCTGLERRHSVTRGRRSGWAVRKVSLKWASMTLEVDKEGQDRRKDSMVPLCVSSDSQHSGKEHKPCLFQGTQWPDKASTLYLPERSLACVVAFSDSHGEEPQDQKIGWHLVRPMHPTLRYLRDESLSAFSLRIASQCISTADLTIVLALIFEGGDWSHSDGWGR